MKELFFSREFAFIHDALVKQYCLTAPFNPPEAYPEIPLFGKTDKNNLIYPMMRTLFQKLSLDKENIDTSKWNPFKEIIKPGNIVLIKPNLVTPYHYLGESARYSTIVHGSVLRPIIDYAALALKGKGSIIIADNPLEHVAFRDILEITGIETMVSNLMKDGHIDIPIQVLDLRPRILKETKNGRFCHEAQAGDPLGYLTIDLGKSSLFSNFDDDPEIHYYTLADRTIDHLDPRYTGESQTDRYHNPNSHKYVVSKSVLNADVIIDVAKMKTHCKAGTTLTLKNMIGMVYLKDCMPHHRPGLPPKGESFSHYPASHYVSARKLYRSLRHKIQIHRFPGFRALRNYLQKKKILISQHVEHGNWEGNDTIWRTILDLMRIAIYADKEGVMKDSPQRTFFGLIDGIVAQHGNGPIAGEHVIASIIFGGFNPVVVDCLAIKAMGINPQAVKSVSKAAEIEKWKLIPENFDISLPGVELPQYNFRLPNGWS